MKNGEPSTKSLSAFGSLLLLLAVLGGSLSYVCHEGFGPHAIMWANDSPLGQLKSVSARLPDTFTGHWQSENWFGTEIPSSSPTLSTLLAMVISPEMYLKIYTPLTMMLLGFSAWLLFRQLRFAPVVCMLGGLAAGLNMHFFSVATWGLGTWNVCCAMILLALAALVTESIKQYWIRGALAGLAVGMSVMEGFDSGAILSVFAGLFILVLCWNTTLTPARKVLQIFSLSFTVVFFSIFISASTLATLIGTQLVGNSIAQSQSQANWDFASQWSLPKAETLRLVVPGLFGYRLIDYSTDPDKSNVYWGRIAQDRHIDEMESDDPKVRVAAAAEMGMPQQILSGLESSDKGVSAARAQIYGNVPLQQRHTGNGDYAGILVVLLAIFAVANSFRGANSPYTVNERRLLWFFAGAALFSLVAAWGRFSFLYQFLYFHLPVFSTIRNPIKFLHPLHIFCIILSGFGLEALHRNYFKSQGAPRPGSWWKQIPMFDRAWAFACLGMIALGAAGFVAFQASKSQLVDYLAQHGFGPDLGPQIALYAQGEVKTALLFLCLSSVVIVSIAWGAWKGKFSPLAWVFLAAILICDLSRSDRPWVRYFDYTEKYSKNPLVEFLKNQPWEHRVAAKLLPRDGSYTLAGPNGALGGACHWWLENDFPAVDIQSLDIDQAPRMPKLDTDYLGNFPIRGGSDQAHPDISLVVRLWRLTNTRYVIGIVNALPFLNQQGDPAYHGFTIKIPFDLTYKPGISETNCEDSGDITAVANPQGSCALFELSNVLPRAKLFSNWQSLKDDATLAALASPDFDLMKTVLVSKDDTVPAPSAPGADPGTVEITDYNPKDIKLHAKAATPAMLLFNERTSPNWKVWVDEKPAVPLRCNFIMRGVFVPAGEHKIEFRFDPPVTTLWVSLCAFASGILLAAYLFYARFSKRSAESVAA